MNENFTVFSVDDSEFDRRLLESALARDYRVESFATAEACLARLGEDGARADLFLLDVDLPGMDGYALCRRIRENPWSAGVAVIFISGLNDLESRMEGFDAGGTDFMVKPINLRELRQKIETAHLLSSERQTLTSRVAESETLTSLILSNLDEYAVLIKFLRALNECDSVRGVFDRLFDLLRAYGLHSAIQLRMTDFEQTLGDHGVTCPLEVDVINHMRGMDRIFEFRMRAAYNFEHVTILIKDMPLDDPDQCGRIRDNVAIAAECANVRLQDMQTRAENAQARAGVAGLLEALKSTLRDFEQKYTLARYRGSSLTLDLNSELGAAFAFLGMSDEQEQQILGIVHRKADELAEIYDFSGETQRTLNEIAASVARIMRPAPADAGEKPEAHVAQGEATGGVELF